MGKAHPVEFRSRVIAFVEEGNGHREAARHFRVSPRFVNDMVILKRLSGGLSAKPQGNHAEGKLAPCAAWPRERLAVKGDLTLDEIVAGMAAVHGVSVHRGSVGGWLHRLGLSHKNTARQRNPAPGGGGAAKGLGSRTSSLIWPTCWKGWCSSTRRASGPPAGLPSASA